MKMLVSYKSKSALFALLTLSFSCTRNHYDKEENLLWLNYLAAKKISTAKLIGALNSDRYNVIDTVYVNDVDIINKLSSYSLKRNLVARNSVNLKAQRYTCNIDLCKNNMCKKIYLYYTMENKGFIDFGDSDSIFQANHFVFYTDSIFRARLNRKMQ